MPLTSPSAAFRPPLAYLALPAVADPPSDADSSVFSHPHLTFSAVLSSVLLPPTRYFPPDPVSLLCVRRSSVVCGFLPIYVAVLAVPYVVSHSSPSVSRVITLPSLFLPTALLPPPPPSRGLLRPPSPPLAPPPLAPDNNITCEDQYISNKTGGGETRWPDVGGSMPRGKCPNKPLSVVGDGIIRPQFLHWHQQ